MSEDKFYNEAFSRNFGLISAPEQKKLRGAKIGIAGMGGVGGIYLLSLLRTGLVNFHIADFDSFELANFNRQAGAEMNSLGKRKTEVMFEKAKAINPFANIKCFDEGINSKNIDEFLKDVNLVLDGLDFFNIEDRILLFRKAREAGIPAITSAPIGFGASLLVFSPKGMSFEKYFALKEDMSREEKIFLFGLGLSPSLVHRKYFKLRNLDINDKKSPSLAGGILACANLVVAESVKIILGKKIMCAPFSLQFDPCLQCLKKRIMLLGNNGPLQLFKRWLVKRFIFK